jgi:hypothetical protein
MNANLNAGADGATPDIPDNCPAERLIESLSAQIAARGLDPLSDEQIDLIESTEPGDRRERDWMLEDLRDRVGLDVPDEAISCVSDDERSDGPGHC